MTDLKSVCPISALVVSDLHTRAEMGLQKYGTTLARTDLSHRDWIQHAYEEALDLAVYLKRIMQEMDNQP